MITLKRFLLLFAVLAGAYAQSASFPSSIVTDSQLKIAANAVQIQLSSTINNSQTSFTVSSCIPIVPNQLVTVDQEIMNVTGCTGNTMVVSSRPFPDSNNVAASHNGGVTITGYIDAWHHNSVRVEIEAIEAALGVNLSNVLSPTSLVQPSFGGTGINNGTKTLTLGGNTVFSGAFNPIFVIPTTGTWTFPNPGIIVGSNDVGTVTSAMLSGSIAPSKITGTAVTQADVSTVTNTMLNGSIAANKLIGTDIATLGTVTAGTWNAGVVQPTYGGTGVNNGSKTITLGGNVIFTGAFNPTFAIPSSSTWTFPASGTLVGSGDTATVTNTMIAGPITVAKGGTGAVLTPSAGGILYSTSSILGILNGTATAGLPLVSGANTTPSWGAAPSAQKFFGTTAPTSPTGNLPGDFYSDTTAHNVYQCQATAATTAPACTTVGVGGWTLVNSGGGGGGGTINALTSDVLASGSGTVVATLAVTRGMDTPAKDLGFVCDGATDDSAAFNAATLVVVRLPDNASCAGFNIQFNSNVTYVCNNCTIKFLSGHTTTPFVLMTSLSNVTFRGVTFDMNGINMASYASPTVITTSGGSGFPPSISIALNLTGGSCTTAPQGFATINGSGVPTAITITDGGTGCTGAVTDSTAWTAAPQCPFGGCVAPTLTIPAPANTTNTVRYPIQVVTSTNVQFMDCSFKSTGSTNTNLSAYIAGLSATTSSVMLTRPKFFNTVGGVQTNINTSAAGNMVVIDHGNYDGTTQNSVIITGGVGNVEVSGGTYTNVTDAAHTTGANGNAIVLSGTTNSRIHDISVQSPRYAGIRATGATTYANITGNTITNSSAGAIVLTAGAERNIVSGNIITGGFEGIIDTGIASRTLGAPNVITENTVTQQRDYCIHAETALVSNNHLADCAVGVYLGQAGVGNSSNIIGNYYNNSVSTNAFLMAVGLGVDSALSGAGNIIDSNNQFIGTAFVNAAPLNTGTRLPIKSISQANPAVVTLYSTGTFANGQVWLIQNVNGMTQMNGRLCTMASVTSTTFACTGINSSGFTVFASELVGGAQAYATQVYTTGTTLSATYTAAAQFTGLIASGTAALGTSAIASGTCASVVTVAAVGKMVGALATDAPSFSFNSDPTAVTGYTPTTSGSLGIVPYPTANNVNFRVCNSTSSSITPGAITLNWRVVR